MMSRSSYSHLRFGLFAVMCLFGLAVTPARAQQPAGPPFVHHLNALVLDPASIGHDLSSIQRFSFLQFLSDNSALLAAFETADHRLGVLMLDADNLNLVEVHWVLPADIGPDPRWDTSATVSGRQAIFVASSEFQSHSDRIESSIIVYRPESSPPWSMHQVVLPERLTALSIDGTSGTYAAVTAPSNEVLYGSLTKAASDVTQYLIEPKRVQEVFDFVPYEYPAGSTLGLGADGVIYGSYKARLFGFYPTDEFFEYLGHLPSEFGHLSKVRLSAVADDEENLMVGGTASDGYLFTLNLETREVIPRGKPTDGTDIRALVHAGQGVFWGIASTPGQSSRLFRFDARSGSLQDLGIPVGTLRDGGRSWTWHAFDITDMAVLPDGRIVLAESGHQAKLLVFDPEKVGLP